MSRLRSLTVGRHALRDINIRRRFALLSHFTHSENQTERKRFETKRVPTTVASLTTSSVVRPSSDCKTEKVRTCDLMWDLPRSYVLSVLLRNVHERVYLREWHATAIVELKSVDVYCGWRQRKELASCMTSSTPRHTHHDVMGVFLLNNVNSTGMFRTK